MTKDQVAMLLETLTGQLHTTNSSDENLLETLRQRMARSLVINKQEETGAEQLFIHSDLYTRDTIDPRQRARIFSIAQKIPQIRTDETESSEQFYIRHSPVLSPVVAGSVPEWAIGSKPVETVGPFKGIDGRDVWVDFYRVEKLITLYVGNQPVLLFKASFGRGTVMVPTAQVASNYQVTAGSFWIHGRLFTNAAPAEKFAGLQVRKGTVKLSTAPVLQNNRLTITPATEITISIELVQSADEHAAVGSLYGKDARDATYLLPSKFDLTIKNNKLTITSIAQASCKIFGQQVDFNFSPAGNTATEYNTGRIFIPWKFQGDSFNIVKADSPWASFSGKAQIKKSFWALPAATLDITNPVQVEGNGAVAIMLGKGILNTRNVGADTEARLSAPMLLGEPGQLDMIDAAADLSGSSERFTLWKEFPDAHASTVGILYKDKSPFFYISMSRGTEMLSSVAEASILADRPVKVDGEPFRIHTISCGVMFAANELKRNIFLLEESVEEFKTIPGIPANNDINKRESIALENALFTVSPVSSFILFGEVTADWKKVERANLFLSFSLLGYLPTLPDPYVGNLSRWRMIFERLRKRNGEAEGLNLICVVRYAPAAEGNDDVKLSFHFGGQSMPQFNELPEPAPATRPLNPSLSRVAGPVRARKGVARFGVIGSAVRYSVSELLRRHDSLSTDIITPEQQPHEPVISNDVIAAMRETPAATTTGRIRVPDMEQAWENAWRLNNEYFSLLDISSNANQLGISFGTEMAIVKTGDVRVNGDNTAAVTYTQDNKFPFIVEGMQVKLPGRNVRTFTLPLSSWEPEINLTPPDRDDPNDPGSPKLPMDPEAGFMYYANDGGPTRIWNNSSALVPLAPVPAVNSIIDDYQSNPGNYTVAAMTLPFGMKAIGYIGRGLDQVTEPEIENIQPQFRRDENNEAKLVGGIQLSLKAGNYGKKWANPAENDSNMFPGYTVQLNNLLDWTGKPSGASNLGDRVTTIFNKDFLIIPLKTPELKKSRGVPVTRIDITGYGANMFSNWFSPSAAMAQVSQARFDVLMGRTGHEVMQVKSILYPWGIRVVRTITVFRAPSGFVFRTDSGWKAESDGVFDFSYKYKEKIDKNGDETDDPESPQYNYKETTVDDTYEFHPGVVRGLYNVRNIKDAPSVTPYETFNIIPAGQNYINGVKGREEKNNAAAFEEPVLCGGVYFDADIEIENVMEGAVGEPAEKDLGSGKKVKYSRVVSKKILGYVQLSPPGKPLTRDQLKALLLLQSGSIGGEVDCEVVIANSGQRMHIHRVDVSAGTDAGGAAPVFVVAARGQVHLPKDGSWTMVQHNAATGDVTQLPKDTAVPLIRTGKRDKINVISPDAVKNHLARIAHATEILRPPGNNAINFGYLQNTATQKALFLTPSYGLDIRKMMSRTPPVFADAYRLMTGNSIFPNIGNALDNFGKAMPMDKVYDAAAEVDAFLKNDLSDAGQKVLELMDIVEKTANGAVVDRGMKMLQKKAGDAVDKALDFVVPQLSEPIYLVNSDALKIYIRYKAKPKEGGEQKGKLDFNIDSFTNEIDKQWRSRMNNLSMVVDLGDMKELMIIKGNFDSRKGKESGYEGGPDDASAGLPTPEIEFSKELKPVIDILTVLGQLSTGDYGAAMKKGLKIAMSNSGEIYEYKFEANKEIALVRFPPTDELYNSAQTPLKLEASLAMGVYFNAALKVTTDPGQLLPTAGAFMKFHGGLSVMCVSVGVGSIYAIGSVDVKLAGDTKVGASLALKFGFGVQIVVSLPVVGNASVTYLIGVEMYADKSKVIVAALMFFRGQANLLGGLVCVTITIEAKGMIERLAGSEETNCAAQVTFALDISIFLVIDISFSKTWGEQRQIA